MIVLEFLILVILLLLALPVCILAIEVFATVFEKATFKPAETELPPGFRFAVLVPAHNESAGLVPTIQDIMAQLGSIGRIVVVADNCSDDTASAARVAGADVIERNDVTRRGKGFALDFGLTYLADDPPAAVIFVDADCRIGPDTLSRLSRTTWATGRSVQARNIVNTPARSTVRDRVSAFAWILKNDIRPRGLAVLGLPCQLMGTGMAVLWKSIVKVDLATGHTIEDVKLGLDLARAGAAPLYCRQATVTSEPPATAAGYAIQRRRWEGGSLRTSLTKAPQIFFGALHRKNILLAAMAADLTVPPVMFLLLTISAAFVLALGHFAISGSSLPLILACAILLLVFATVLLAWARYGRHVLLLKDFVLLPWVLIRKIPFYVQVWKKRHEGWIRTSRD